MQRALRGEPEALFELEFEFCLLLLNDCGPDIQGVGVVVNTGEPEDVCAQIEVRNSEGAAVVRVYRHLANEQPAVRIFHDFARLVGIHIRAIAIGH